MAELKTPKVLSLPFCPCLVFKDAVCAVLPHSAVKKGCLEGFVQVQY